MLTTLKPCTYMPYPEQLVTPMRQELVALGVSELRTKKEVDDAFRQSSGGTMVLVVNSVCGCAAAMARPAVRLAMQHARQPDSYCTVFAGQDMEATAHARSYLAGIPPSSPFIALFKEGDVAYVIERRHIEGRSAQAIAADLVSAFEQYCGTDTAAGEGPVSPAIVDLGFPASFRPFR